VEKLPSKPNKRDLAETDGGQSQVVALLDSDDEAPIQNSLHARRDLAPRKIPKLKVTRDQLSGGMKLKNHTQQASKSQDGISPTSTKAGENIAKRQLFKELPMDDDSLVIDMSERCTESSPENKARVRLDSSFSVSMGPVSIVSKDTNGPEATYEAITLHKEIGDKSAPIALSIPIRLLPALERAMELINVKIEGGCQLPKPQDLIQRGDELDWEFNLEGFHSNQNPKVDIKLDATFSLIGESIRWQKGTFQVLSFTRHAKHGEKKGKKAFSIGVPWKLFKVFHLAIKTFAILQSSKM